MNSKLKNMQLYWPWKTQVCYLCVFTLSSALHIMVFPKVHNWTLLSHSVEVRHISGSGKSLQVREVEPLLLTCLNNLSRSHHWTSVESGWLDLFGITGVTAFPKKSWNHVANFYYPQPMAKSGLEYLVLLLFSSYKNLALSFSTTRVSSLVSWSESISVDCSTLLYIAATLFFTVVVALSRFAGPSLADSDFLE